MAMKISEVEIENYKSIDNIKLDSVNDLSIFIGENDAGKSATLEAIRMFLKPLGKPYENQFHMGNEDDIVISGRFENVPEELKEEFSDNVSVSDNELEIRRVWEFPDSSRKKATTYVGGDKLTSTTMPDRGDLNKTGVRNRIWSHLPEVLYVPAERNISEETEFKSNTLIDRLLSPLLQNNENIKEQRAVLEEALDTNVESVQSGIQRELTDQVSSISEVKIEMGSINLSKAFSPSIKVKDQFSEQSVPIGERGSGVGSMFVLSMIETYRKEQIGDGYVMLFEEPGNWLHPGAKRQMLSALKNIADNEGQVMFTTHSPVFIDRRGDGDLISVERNGGVTDIEQVGNDHLSLLDTLGVRNSDVLQSDFVVYTEGPSDVQMLEVVAKNVLDPEERHRVTIQHLGGDNINASNVDNLGQINRNFAVVFDSDKVSENDSPSNKKLEFKDTVSRSDYNAFVEILDKNEIENYFTAEAINDSLGLHVDEDFVGDFDDIPDKIGRQIASEHQGEDVEDQEEVVCDACNYVVNRNENYPKNKGKGRDIIKAVYENGDRIPGLEAVFEKVSDQMN